MYKKHHYILFVILQAAMSVYIYSYFPFESSKNAICVYLLQLPIWMMFTYLKIPKADGQNSQKWRERYLFCLFLGFGISILVLIIALVIASFFAAVTGKDMALVLINSFVPLHIISLIFGTWFFAKEIERLKYFGLDYQETIDDRETFEEPLDIGHPDKVETLKMLTILNLDNRIGTNELKNRYFELSKLYHPDRLNQMGQEDRQVAENEFKRIKRAYEFIKKQIESGEL